MVFSTMTFIWIVLPVLLVLGLLIREKRAQDLFLLFVSILFFFWGGPQFLLLLLAAVLINWVGGLLIEKNRDEAKVKWILFLFVAIDLGVLCYYKYTGFLLRNVYTLLHREMPEFSMALPVGVSFFTFQAITYLVDIYRGQAKAQRSILKVALYISFFAKLVSGPIVRYKDMEAELNERVITREGIYGGFRRFLYGLTKKVLISNLAGAATDIFFAADLSKISAAEAWLGVIFYGLQLYYDFSGYSDMAIGLAEVFGFHFAENFNYPYLSKSIAEFWRRWHISLGAFFREYVYFPLGGSRGGILKTCRNIGIVFLLTGLWHGASWNFVFWGLYQGFFNILERLGLAKILKKVPVLGHIYCVLVVFMAWPFFRIDNINVGLHYIFHMLQPWKYRVHTTAMALAMNPRAVLVLIAGILGCGVLQSILQLPTLRPVTDKWKNSAAEAIYLGVLLFLSLLLLAGGTSNAFIYAKF